MVALVRDLPLVALGIMVAGPVALVLLAFARPGWLPLSIAGGAAYVGMPALSLLWVRAHTPGGMRT